MSEEQSTDQHCDDQTETDAETLLSEKEYELGDDLRRISVSIGLWEEIGDSEFDYVIVGSNPDDGSDRVAFGVHRQELPLQFPE